MELGRGGGTPGRGVGGGWGGGGISIDGTCIPEKKISLGAAPVLFGTLTFDVTFFIVKIAYYLALSFVAIDFFPSHIVFPIYNVINKSHSL